MHGFSESLSTQKLPNVSQYGGAIGNIVFVQNVNDFPQASGGVITLADNYTYFILTSIDLQGARLVCGQNTTIIGGSSENCRLKSTGLVGTALITSVYSLPMRNLTIEADVALNLNGADPNNAALNWFGVNFTDSNTVGTIANYSNFTMTDSAFLNSSGMTFDGTFGTIAFTQCFFDNRTNGTSIIIPNTANITRRFRTIYSSFVANSGETSLDVSISANIPSEGYNLDNVNFSGGGTYTDGVTYTSDKALFVNCKGIINSAAICSYSMLNNAVATDIVTQGVPVKIAGTTTANENNQKFSHTNNRATYTGAITRLFECTAVVTLLAAGPAKTIGLYLAKDGVIIPDSEMYATTNSSNRAESIAIQTIVSLNTNNYIELWIENETDNTDVTVTYLNLIINALT